LDHTGLRFEDTGRGDFFRFSRGGLAESCSTAKEFAIRGLVTDLDRERQLRALYDVGRAAWPEVALSFEAFRARWAGWEGGVDEAMAPAGAPPERASELYLAVACSAGDPAALALFDSRYLVVVDAAVARIDASADFAAEVRQVLRERLLVGPDAKLRDYRGQGSLAGWVRTAAVRTALNLRRAGKHYVAATRVEEPLGARLAPESLLARAQHRDEVMAALQRALAALDPEERLLLRYYYADGLTLSKIAVLLRVSVTTVFRRLTAATESVLDGVRAELRDRLGLSSDSLDSLLRDVRGEIDLSLSQMLGRDPGT
jgi:RNA polymerase sigma-70 factor (ECF subfamily)